MNLPLRSKHAAEMYRALSLFPKELEGEFLDPDKLKGHFRDFHGRPVQDIVEALHQYGQDGFFKYEIMLMPGYLKQGKELAQITAAFSKLQPEPGSPPVAYHGLSGPVHAKVIAERPLTKAEASSLPDEAKRYLAFRLSDIDRTRLREGLAIYNDNSFIQPSRLVKSTQSETRAAKLPTLDLSNLSLKPESYNKHTGVLRLTPDHNRTIAGKTGVKRPKDSKNADKKYLQCWVMECVFKSDKTLKHGVEISSILGINKNIVDKTTTKKIENAKTAINNKVADGGGPKNLIKIQNGKVFLNNSYL